KNQLERWKSIYYEYPRTFWMLVGITFVDRLGGALLFPFFALYLTAKFGIGMTEVGILFAIYALSSLFGSILGGAFTDRFGRKQIVIFALIATSLSSVLMGLVNSITVFFMLAALVGVIDIGGPARQAMVADLLPEKKRAQGYGIMRVAFNLSVTIGPAIGGLLAARSYLLLFITDAVISLIVAALVFVLIPETKPETAPGAEEENVSQTFGGYALVFRDYLFLAFIGVSILMGLVYMNLNTTLGVFLRDTFSVSEARYGALLSLNALMVVLFQFPIMRKIENKPPMLMMAAGMVLYTIGFVMYGFVATTLFFAMAMVILTVGEMLVAPVAQSLVAHFSPEDMRGRYMAIFGISGAVPFALGPLLAGMVLDNAPDQRILWYAVGIVGVLATFGFLWLHRKTTEKKPHVEREIAPEAV
ncbi:MAG: MFS transporter, partial [Anaerolineales bacterium]|nr:MFS transporter [Candidatus Desulfolinea nitratireducens]